MDIEIKKKKIFKKEVLTGALGQGALDVTEGPRALPLLQDIEG